MDPFINVLGDGFCVASTSIGTVGPGNTNEIVANSLNLPTAGKRYALAADTVFKSALGISARSRFGVTIAE